MAKRSGRRVRPVAAEIEYSARGSECSSRQREIAVDVNRRVATREGTRGLAEVCGDCNRDAGLLGDRACVAADRETVHAHGGVNAAISDPDAVEIDIVGGTRDTRSSRSS